MKVLVVEDDKKIALAIKKGLEQESMVVDAVFDGEEGYDFALTETYDVIVLDLMLPSMSGEEITEKLRQNAITTPILMLTAKSSLPNKIEGLAVGADDYLTKPFEFEELVARIKALSRRPKAYVSNELSCKNLQVNLVSKEVTLSGKLIQLSKKEYTLLEYLLKNKNNIVSKDQILENVWNFDADVLPNTVEVYVRYLRQKLDNDIIKTVRGFGYKITD